MIDKRNGKKREKMTKEREKVKGRRKEEKKEEGNEVREGRKDRRMDKSISGRWMGEHFKGRGDDRE